MFSTHRGGGIEQCCSLSVCHMPPSSKLVHIGAFESYGYHRSHTHNHLTALCSGLPGRSVPEETVTHSHTSWSSNSIYQFPPSTTIHSILIVQFMCLTVLWHCWLGARKSIWPVKIKWWGVGVVICLERDTDCLHNGPADATASQNPHHLLPRLNPDWFYLSHTGLPRLSWKRDR